MRKQSGKILVDISESTRNNPRTGGIPTYTLPLPFLWHWSSHPELYSELQSWISIIIFIYHRVHLIHHQGYILLKSRKLLRYERIAVSTHLIVWRVWYQRISDELTHFSVSLNHKTVLIEGLSQKIQIQTNFQNI